jgi:formate C-acetyltransferase
MYRKYNERLAALKKQKEIHTQEKIKYYGSTDEDDYGKIVPPEGAVFEPIYNDVANKNFYGAKAWADNFAKLMDMHPVYVDKRDAIAGKWMYLLQNYRACDMAEEFDYSHLKAEQELYDITSGIGKMHHFAGDYTIGLGLGFGGLLDKVRRYKSQYGPEKAEFYESEEKVITAIQRWIIRTCEQIESLISAEKDKVYKQNLKEMLEVNRAVVNAPPKTFRQACQWMAWFNMASRTYDRDGAGCQLDVILKHFYENDKNNGRIDGEDAIFIVACLLINDPQYYQISGPGEKGEDVTNELSYLILEAAHRIKIATNLTIRVHEKLDNKLYDTGVRNLITDKTGCPRFSGDDALVKGFMKNGYSLSEARQRIAVGCNWMSLQGREYTLNDTVKINFAKVFEVALNEMMECSEIHNTAMLFDLFAKHLKKAVLCTAKGLDFHLAHQWENAPELMLNLMCHGTIEKGLDASNGGVQYYNMCIDGAGLATVADSFAALEQRIETEHKIEYSDLANAIISNYEGVSGERIRLLMKNSDRYGKGNSYGDRWALKISRLFTKLVKNGTTPKGRNMIPGLFSWSHTVAMGKKVHATPNGRRDFEPISHGANPDPGFRRDGAATAMAKAIAKVQPAYGNTAPFQLELDPQTMDLDETVKNIGALMKGHFDLGGTLININIVDAKKIRKAHKNPELYPDLVVRVTGFTAYFATLSEEFRQLVVDRLITESLI